MLSRQPGWRSPTSTVLWPAIISSVSALLGVAMGGFLTARVQKRQWARGQQIEACAAIVVESTRVQLSLRGQWKHDQRVDWVSWNEPSRRSAWSRTVRSSRPRARQMRCSGGTAIASTGAKSPMRRHGSRQRSRWRPRGWRSSIQRNVTSWARRIGWIGFRSAGRPVTCRASTPGPVPPTRRDVVARACTRLGSLPARRGFTTGAVDHYKGRRSSLRVHSDSRSMMSWTPPRDKAVRLRTRPPPSSPRTARCTRFNINPVCATLPDLAFVEHDAGCPGCDERDRLPPRTPGKGPSRRGGRWRWML